MLKSWQLHTSLNLAVAFTAVLQDFDIEHKILSVTCDNASNNDTMVTEMDKMLISFSAVNCTQCFAHIINLVSKSLLHQSDMKKDNKSGRDIDDDEKSLLDLAGDIGGEELDMTKETDTADKETEDSDNLEGWVDEAAALTSEQQQVLEASVQPVKRMLVKVQQDKSIRLTITLIAFT